MRNRRNRLVGVLVAIATALVALATLPGCGLGDKKQMAERILSASEATVDAGAVRGRVGYTFEVIETQYEIPDGARRITVPTTLVTDIDLVEFRSQILEPTGVEPAFIYRGDTLYARRGGLTADARTERAWVKLDFGDLRASDDSQLRPGSFLPVPYNLALQVYLLAGTLTGSVEEVGREDVEGVPTTHYKMKVDFEKAVDALDDDRIAGIEKTFRASSFELGVYDAEAWLDADGLPRRIRVRAVQELTRKDRFGVTIDFIVDAVGGDAVAIDRPPVDGVYEVRSLPQLVEGLVSA